MWGKGLLSDNEFFKNIQGMINNEFIKIYFWSQMIFFVPEI